MNVDHRSASNVRGRPRVRRARPAAVLLLALSWLVIVAITDVVIDQSALLPALLAITPALAAFTCRVRVTLEVALASAMVASLLGFADKDFISLQHGVDIVAVVSVGALSVVTSRSRARMETALAAAESLASTDPLTGLLNRRGLAERSQALVDLRHGPQLWLLLLDVDHFKAINDVYGHAGGDEVLWQVAARIKRVLRKGDLIARYGGDEFVLVLTPDGEDDMIGLAERIRGAVVSGPVATRRGHVAVSVSGGLSVIDRFETDVSSATGRADVALYSSKAAGRDRITVQELVGRRGEGNTAPGPQLPEAVWRISRGN